MRRNSVKQNKAVIWCHVI